LPEINHHIIKRISFDGEPSFSFGLYRSRKERFQEDFIGIEREESGPNFLLIIGKLTVERKIEIRQLIHFLKRPCFQVTAPQ